MKYEKQWIEVCDMKVLASDTQAQEKESKLLFPPHNTLQQQP